VRFDGGAHGFGLFARALAIHNDGEGAVEARAEAFGKKVVGAAGVEALGSVAVVGDAEVQVQ
jgi:hypothetical protein